MTCNKLKEASPTPESVYIEQVRRYRLFGYIQVVNTPLYLLHFPVSLIGRLV